MLVLKRHSARIFASGDENDFSDNSETCRSSLRLVARLMTISAPIPQHGSGLFRDGKRSPLRPDRPTRPWGEDVPSGSVPSARVPPKRGLSTIPVKAFAIRRVQHSQYSRPFPSTGETFVLPTVRALAAPKRAFDRNRTRRVEFVGTGPGHLLYEDGDDVAPGKSMLPL